VLRELLAVHHQDQAQSTAIANGKAERFIRTMLREWAYGAIYASSVERAAALPGWLERYNTRRPHGSLSHKPPISRLTGTNLLGSYTPSVLSQKSAAS
jgi:transposase InsO family protein